MRDQAIYNLYPQVVKIIANTFAYDAQGNLVELDDSAIAIEIERLQGIADAQAAFDAEKTQAETDAVTNYQVLPDWVKTISADDAAAYVHDNVLNSMDQTALDALIDNRFSGVTTFAAAAPLILDTFKDIGGQLIMFRDMMQIVIKLLMYIRDLIIKYRQS